jgi:muconolactone delta-isomerase
MEYIIVFDPDQMNASMMETSHYFIEKFGSYEDAKAVAEIWKANGDCNNYGIYALCSDDKNHVI